jgi:hypothetical protein
VTAAATLCIYSRHRLNGCAGYLNHNSANK